MCSSELHMELSQPIFQEKAYPGATLKCQAGLTGIQLLFSVKWLRKWISSRIPRSALGQYVLRKQIAPQAVAKDVEHTKISRKTLWIL